MSGVPELVAKKKQRDEKWAAAAAAAGQEAKKQAKVKRALIFKKAAAYAKEAAAQERELVWAKRVAKSKGGFHVEAEPRVMFVIRIRGLNKIHPKTKKILQLLRLRQVNNGIFLRVNKATLGLLKYVEPYIAFGYPSRKSIKELIYKRGFGKVNGNRIPLTDNKLVEQHLGKYGIICMEDLINEIHTCGPAFKQASNFLWPFQLSSALGGMDKKRVHYVEGGQAGNRQELINNLIKRMN